MNPCYVCSYIPHAVGTDRLIFPREVPPRTAKCLLHLFLCCIQGRVQIIMADISTAYVNTTVWDYNHITQKVISDTTALEEVIKNMYRIGVPNMDLRALHIRKRGYITVSSPSAVCDVTIPHGNPCPCQNRTVLRL